MYAWVFIHLHGKRWERLGNAVYDKSGRRINVVCIDKVFHNAFFF